MGVRLAPPGPECSGSSRSSLPLTISPQFSLPFQAALDGFPRLVFRSGMVESPRLLAFWRSKIQAPPRWGKVYRPGLFD